MLAQRPDAGGTQLSKVIWIWRSAARVAVSMALAASVALEPAMSAPASTAPAASAASGHPRILFLNSYGYGRHGVETYTRSFMAAVGRQGWSANDVMVEYLDLNRAGTPALRQLNRDLLLRKYAGQRIDFVVTTQQPALNFLLDELGELAPDAPVMAPVAVVPPQGLVSKHHFVMQRVRVDIVGTVESALAVLPLTRHVAVALGTGEEDLALKREFQANAGRWAGRLAFTYLDGLSHADVLRHAGQLPPHTVLVLGLYNRDKTGAAYVPVEVGLGLQKVANAPVFTLFDSAMGTGVVGGSMLRIQEDAESDAEFALSVIQGRIRLTERVTPLPRHFVTMYDWQALERWGGKPSRVPAGAVVINQPLTLWGQYRREVIGATVVVLVLLASSISLLIQNRRRRQAEHAARESEARFKVLVEQAPEAILVFDADEMRFVAANANAEQLTGLSRDELLAGGPERLYGPDQPDKQPVADSLMVHLNQALAGQEVVFDRVVSTPQGQQRYCEVRVVRLPSSKGRLLRVSYIDLTGRREAEQAVHQLNAELEQRVSERTAQLQAANADLAQARDEAQAATRIKSEFLANMSHEIRTPMNAILGMTNLAFGTDLSTRQRGYLGHVKSAALSLLKIIDDILDFSKVEAGKLEIESTPFLLDDVLDRVVAVIGLKARDKGLDLLLNVPADIPQSLVGDPLRLGQVLINLCANAVKFTDRGEVLIAVTQVGDDQQGLRLRFSVRDTGLGMSKDQVQRLFKPFSQVDASTTRLYGGTGLGLAISKQLVGLMQGDIGVDSQPGQGSDFHFRVRFEKGTAAAPALTVPPSLRGLRVLVMDPSENARAIVSAQLRSLGHEVLTVSSAEAGLAELVRAVAGKKPHDLVLLDAKLVQPEGGGLIEHVRCALAQAHTAKLLLMAAHGDDQAARLAVSGQVDGCLFQPGNAAALLEAIATAFGDENAAGGTAGPTAALAGDAGAVLASLRGRRVLLVEDNLINQMVAAELLTDVAGMSVTIAGDGEQAIASIASAHFDAVLMDVQMPVMDGIRATTLIRQEWGAERLPVIGMTAHAMARDREKCLSVGMNDYVTKPFEPQRLFAVLAKWIGERVPETMPPANGEARARTEPARPAVSLELGLQRCMGREDLYVRIVQRFLDTRGDDPAAIKAAVLAGDLDAAAQLAHQVISTAGTIGAEALSEAGRTLQLAIEAGEASRWPGLLAAFTTQHGVVTAALRAYLLGAGLRPQANAVA
ncbi:MAG: response regulator [Rubrivivax sp.]|nr:MAG: response regulator [Rubrivivax sp.]